MTQPTSEALSEGRMAAIRKHLESPGVPEFSCTMVSHNELSALLATLDQALARCEAAEKRVEELTAAAHDILEGWPNNDEQFDRGMDALVSALPDAAQPEPDTGGVE